MCYDGVVGLVIFSDCIILLLIVVVILVRSWVCMIFNCVVYVVDFVIMFNILLFSVVGCVCLVIWWLIIVGYWLSIIFLVICID